MSLDTTISWSFVGTGALILIGFMKSYLAMLRLQESDFVNWGELSDAEEVEAQAQAGQLTRLMWATGTTALAALIWAERDWLAEWTAA